MTSDAIRIDLWLWYTRMFKSRSLAARAVKETRIRINRQIVTKVSQPVRIGDVLTFPHHDQVRVLKVLAIGERRGPASEARQLYQDLSSAAAPAATASPALAVPCDMPGPATRGSADICGSDLRRPG